MGRELGWVHASGQGQVSSYTVIRHPVSKAYADETPYVLALIRLAEGPTMMSVLCNCEPEGIRVGLAVEVVFERWSDEITIAKFQPSKGN